MYTYQDLEPHLFSDDLQNFVKSAIADYKGGNAYKTASIGYDYFCGKNRTINEYQKLLYTLSGEAVPDNFSANFKFCNAFFRIFVTQEVSHLLGEGANFNEPKTKERLGGSEFDNQLIKLAKKALWGTSAYGFFNVDHIDVFDALEFVPLFDEENGALKAGIRFWQIDPKKPLRATLYREDGYMEFMWTKEQDTILKELTPYIQIVQTTVADGSEIIDGENYPNFPVVPLWANTEKQSELTRIREKIDGYDLIQSGFANDLDDASQIYWTIQNAGGMGDIDLAKFIERLKVVKAATLSDEGATAEAHTLEVPYNARVQALQELRESLYRDAMALDTEKISAGNQTATAIRAAYENLSHKCDDFEMCVSDFIYKLLELVGIKDSPTFKRSQIVNVEEETNIVLSAAQYLDDETILKHLPFLNVDEIETILKNKDAEEFNRYGDE